MYCGPYVQNHDAATARQVTLAELGGLDIVVENAGTARAHLGGISSMPDEEWLDALNLNYLSAVRLTDALLPALRQAGAAARSSTSPPERPSPRRPPLAPYGAAKAALNAYGKALTSEPSPTSRPTAQ